MTTDARVLSRKLAQAVTDSVGLRFNFDREDVAKIASALDQARRETLHDVVVYATMRSMIADQSKHVETLAGNVVKEAREDGALAELHGLELWCRQQAKEMT